MAKTSKRLILSIVTLVLLVFAIGTTTFAWFTLSARATIGEITGEIIGSDGLHIALGLDNEVELTEYRTNLRADDWQVIMNEINKNKVDAFKFGAVSTENGINFNQLVVEEQNLITRYNKTKLTNANTHGGYLEFSVHFKSGSGGVINWRDYGFIDNSQTTREFNPTVSYLQQLDNDKETKDKIQTASSNAARIGISKYIEDENGLKEEAVIVQKKDQSNANTIMSQYAKDLGQFTYISNMGNDIYWAMGDSYVLKKIIKTYTLNQDHFIIENSNVANANELLVNEVKLAMANTDVEEAGKNITQLKLVQPEILATENDVTNGDATEVGEVLQEEDLSKGYKASVIVRVWLEGWDVDAYDSIFQLGLNFNLTFKKGSIL